MAVAPVAAKAGKTVLPAIIGGVTQLGGALLGHRAQNKATKAQQSATDQAIALEREREKAKQARYERDYELYRQQVDTWEIARRQALARQGITLPEHIPYDRMSTGRGTRGPTTYAPGMDGKVSPKAPWSPAGAPAPAPGGTLGEIAGGGGGGAFNLYDSQQGAGATATDAMMVDRFRSPNVPGLSGGTLGDMVGVDWSDWRNYAPR